MAKIIIVEDDLMIAEIYRKKFTEVGFEVLTADSGEQTLDLARKEKPDVILLDLVMPKMDGFEVIKRIRGEDFDKNIKIIVSSNLGREEDRDKAIKLGANGFMLKSNYTPSILVEEVMRIVNQYQEEKKNDEKRQHNHGNGAPAGNSKKVLMIEDEDIFIDMFGKKLEQDGYAVVSAQNGAWGVKEALDNNFDIFIIDMIMPAMTGEEIIEKLKLEDKTKNIPIIVLSASVDEKAQERVLKMGVNAFFIKTQLIPSELSKKVSELLKQPGI